MPSVNGFNAHNYNFLLAKAHAYGFHIKKSKLLQSYIKNMTKEQCWFSLVRIFLYKDKLHDSVLILKNAGQKKPVF